METLPVGTKVVIEKSDCARGTWPRYHGRKGFIIAVNKETFIDGSVYVEYGVAFTDEVRFNKNWRTDAWFKPSEIKPDSKNFDLKISF